MHVNSFPSLISVAVFWFAVASRVDALCRTPDGSLSTDLPCNPGAANSTCCELGFSCTTNNFCLDKDNVGTDGLSINDFYIRGTCTDESWTSEACAQHCVSSQPNSGEKAVYCGNGTWCCDADAPNCCTAASAEKFELGDPSVYTVIGSGSAPQNPIPKPSVSPATTTPVSSPSAPIAQSATPTSSPLSSNASPEEKQESKGNGNDKVVAVGVGVGVPLGILLLGSIAFAVWWFRRIERRMQQRDHIMREEVRAEVFKAVELSSMSSVYEMGSERSERFERAEKFARHDHVEMP